MTKVVKTGKTSYIVLFILCFISGYILNVVGYVIKFTYKLKSNYTQCKIQNRLHILNKNFDDAKFPSSTIWHVLIRKSTVHRIMDPARIFTRLDICHTYRFDI